MKVAESSALISLPYKWVKQHNIQKGDELEVEEKGNSIIIRTDSFHSDKEVEVDISELDRTTIMYVIRSFYRLGYDSVKLIFKDPTTIYQRKGKDISVISVIHTEINRLIGYEIMQEKENFCIIKDLQGTSDKDFEQVLRRIFLLLQDTVEEFIDGAKKNKKPMLESIENRHDTITKFVSHCLRLLSKRGKDIGKTANNYHIIASLDRITDIIKYSARDLIESNIKISKETADIFNLTKENLLEFYEIYYKYNNEKIQNINERRYKAEKKLKALKPENTIEIITASKIFTISEILLDLIESRTALNY